MVQSRLNKTVNYPEIQTLDAEDNDYEATVYETEILDVPLIIALGQSRDRFKNENIIYFPIYLVKNDEVDKQIGVYEIKDYLVPNVLDDEGDVDISSFLIGKPLLYSFVTEELLKNKEEKKEDEEEDEEDEEDEEEDEQTVEMETEEKERYIEKEDDIWIKKFLQNNNYNIEDNEGGGDCLFAAIRDGFKKIDKDISVEKLRKMLANEVTESVFEGYKEQYDAINSEYNKNIKELRKLAAEHKALKKKLELTNDRNIQTKIIAEADEIKKEHTQLKSDKQNTKELKEEFEFMKGINTIEAFKAKVQTCDFWGETWTLSTLERILNIKFILFSREAFLEGDFNNVMQCGQLNDTILEEEGIFEPDYYIMLDYQGSHYELITYKNKGAFTFKELPYDVKILISKNCLEGSSGGPYYIIPEFREFMNKSKDITETNKDGKS